MTQQSDTRQWVRQKKAGQTRSKFSLKKNFLFRESSRKFYIFYIVSLKLNTFTGFDE